MANINPRKLEQRFVTALLIGPACLFVIYWGGPLFYLLLLLALGISWYEAFHITMKIKPRALYVPGSFLYIGLCFASYFSLLYFSPLYPLLLILLVIASDVGAYFFGKIIGGPKMWEAVSPNKTWAGLLGACVSPMVIYLLWSCVMETPETLVRYFEVVVFGGLIGIAGQAGDLLISSLKRKAGVKDSGKLLPGHGGVLDRIDALMLSAPVFLLASVMA